MLQWLESVLAKIAAGELLPASYYCELDGNAVLDTQDNDREFEMAWNRLREDVKRPCLEEAIPNAVRSVAEKIRKESFLAVNCFARQHELASHVSDDIDLIIRSFIVDLKMNFRYQIWILYQQGKFPISNGLASIF